MQLNPIYHRKRTSAVGTTVRSADLGTASTLFELGPDPNHHIDAERHPLLHIAITEEDLAMVKVLVEHGAVINPSQCNDYNAINHAEIVGARELKSI